MICPLCKTNETTDKVVKIQQKIAQGKINLAELSVCDECSNCLVVKAGDSAFVLSVKEADEPATCQWELEIGEHDIYHTSCGNAQIFICCNVEENNYKYCPYCGKPIKQVEPKSLFCTFDE